MCRERRRGFDFKGVNEVIYNENGVTIRSIPAIHSLVIDVNYFGFSGDNYSGRLSLGLDLGCDSPSAGCLRAKSLA